MPTLTVGDLRQRAQKATASVYGTRKSASTMILESVKAQSTAKGYHIFLSHSFNDAEIILGIKLKLEDYGYTTYIDWLEDPELDRTKVTPTTAEKLRQRMNNCRSLFYATTPSSPHSKWMPWECGYFDGKRNRTAILPITDYGKSSFDGQEYLGLYPYITEDPTQYTSTKKLWVNKSTSIYCGFDEWINGKEPYKHE